jgi:hypothetical protein
MKGDGEIVQGQSKEFLRVEVHAEGAFTVDLSIFRAGSGRKKFMLFRAKKNPAHDHPTGCIEPQFSGRARPGLGLGRAARTLYSVKQLKTTFRVGLGPQKISRALRSLCPRPSSKVRGRAGLGPGLRAGPSRAQYAQV